MVHEVESGYEIIPISKKALKHYVGARTAQFIGDACVFNRIKDYTDDKLVQVHLIVNVEFQSAKTLAAAVLLRNYYSKLDTQKANKRNWKKWVMFRKEYLLKKKRENGQLVCEYCGKTGLHIDNRPGKKIRLATIDHIRPISMGADMYDERNMAVACFPCNQKKGTADYTMRMLRRRNMAKYLIVSLKNMICKYLGY